LVAPLTLDQLNVGVLDTPVAPFDGAESVGAASSPPPLVVKLKMLENWPCCVGETVLL
jgi:hypothetical protein